MAKNLTAKQTEVLNAMIAYGDRIDGRMNFARKACPGFNLNSVDALVRAGLVSREYDADAKHSWYTVN